MKRAGLFWDSLKPSVMGRALLRSDRKLIRFVIQCVPLAGSPGKCWFTKRTKGQYICIHTYHEVRLCVL
jgi:hypothetical protein